MSDRYIEETRKQTLARAVKSGALKESLDRLLTNVAKPISDALKPLLQKMHPDIDFFDPAITTGLEFATLQAVAEIVAVSGSIAGKITDLNLSEGEALEKTDALARIMRGYSGERLGDSAGQSVVAFLPMIKDLLLNASSIGLLGKKDTPVARKLPPASVFEKLD